MPLTPKRLGQRLVARRVLVLKGRLGRVGGLVLHRERPRPVEVVAGDGEGQDNQHLHAAHDALELLVDVGELALGRRVGRLGLLTAALRHAPGGRAERQLLRPADSFEGRWHVNAANDLAAGDIVSIDSGHGWFGAGLVERREGDRLVVAIRSLEDLPVERDEARLAEFAAWRAEQGRRWHEEHASES